MLTATIGISNLVLWSEKMDLESVMVDICIFYFWWQTHPSTVGGNLTCIVDPELNRLFLIKYWFFLTHIGFFSPILVVGLDLVVITGEKEVTYFISSILVFFDLYWSNSLTFVQNEHEVRIRTQI
jgi:hypothetical protein